ncbi:hypothetical protein BC567DRAFT_220975 [Phyllosticta citribraziliensis]
MGEASKQTVQATEEPAPKVTCAPANACTYSRVRSKEPHVFHDQVSNARPFHPCPPAVTDPICRSPAMLDGP